MDSNGDLQDSGASATGGVVTADLTGDVTGDVKAGDGTTVLDSGTDGTDATFTGDVTGNLTGNADTATSATSATSATTATTATSNLTTDAVGSFAFLRHETLNVSLVYGTNYAGSLLTPTGLKMSSSGSSITWDESSDSSRAGTWKCLSAVTASAGFYSVGLFVKVSLT